MTAEQYAADRKRQENMARLAVERSIPVDPEVNAEGIERARQALRIGRTQ